MAKRRSMSRRGSQRSFQRSAGGNSVHPKNRLRARPMRGGFRI